jgi:hypothetical protein
VRQLLLGFSSEGITGSQDLDTWRRSFTAAFASAEDAVPVSWGASSRVDGEPFESNPELTTVSVYGNCNILTCI